MELLKFTCEDGSQSYAVTASYALLQWQDNIFPPTKLPENPPVLEVIVVGEPRHGPYDAEFLMLLIGGIERNYGTAPQIPEEFLNKNWYNDLPKKLGHHSILQHLKDGNEKVIEYEQVCWNILFWLFQNGNIVKLERK